VTGVRLKPDPLSTGGTMPEAASTEFWKDLKPITDVFKPDGLPEVFYADTTSDDMRYYVPLTETVFTRPLFISPAQNRWCDILMATGPGLVNRHYHPHQVFGFTLSGKWGYLEHDWTATAGDFLYEAPGEAHTLVAYEHEDPMKIFFNVTGPLIWLDENGEAEGHFDVHDYIAISKEHYEKVGLGADYIEGLFR
jgi:2,4'-dihydroxyacetophenone dioxygenase